MVECAAYSSYWSSCACIFAVLRVGPEAFASAGTRFCRRMARLDRKALPAPRARALATHSAEKFHRGDHCVVFLDEGVPTWALNQNFFELGSFCLLCELCSCIPARSSRIELPLRALLELPISRIGDGGARVALEFLLMLIVRAFATARRRPMRAAAMVYRVHPVQSAYHFNGGGSRRGRVGRSSIGGGVEPIFCRERHESLRTVFVTGEWPRAGRKFSRSHSAHSSASR